MNYMKDVTNVFSKATDFADDSFESAEERQKMLNIDNSLNKPLNSAIIFANC